jgi:voltage-gated potassium channel
MLRRGRRRKIADRSRTMRAGALLLIVLVGACLSYMAVGLSAFDALYQTMVTVTTVGYDEIGTDDPSRSYRAVTLVVMVLGVGTTLYALGIAVEVLLEGRLEELFGRRKMHREIAAMEGHIIVCGGGRVGMELVTEILEAGKQLVMIDLQASSLEFPEGVFAIEGDATVDGILESAGVGRAESLVTALSTDADNVYVTLSARSLQPSLFIVARAHAHGADDKLARAGADRVVNPQFIGGRRMATYALQPNVAEFLDVTMHDGDVEWRLEEVTIGEKTAIAYETVGGLNIRRELGCLVLALRVGDRFINNPDPDVPLEPGAVLIAMGTHSELSSLREWAGNKE